jgi:DNA-binding XRE family transcriptional regulator
MMVEPIYREIGFRIARARDHAGLTQQALANSVGLGRTSIVNIEAGRQRVMVHHLAAVARTLGVRLASLLPGAAE